MSKRVQSGAETIENAVEMFDEIADTIQQAEQGIREISDATDDQAASSEEVVSMVDEVSAVSQQTAAEATNVSAATEEQASSLSEASANIQHLSSLAEELHNNVEDFQVEQSNASSLGDETDVFAAKTGTQGPNRDEDLTVLKPDGDVPVPMSDGGNDSKHPSDDQRSREL